MTLAEHKVDAAQRLPALNNKKLLQAIDLLISQDEGKSELSERQKKI
jgi:hypothetical protein